MLEWKTLRDHGVTFFVMDDESFKEQTQGHLASVEISELPRSYSSYDINVTELIAWLIRLTVPWNPENLLSKTERYK